MKKIRSSYQDIYNKNMKILNSEQREAVETIDGPVVVVAGPGTGKTQILTLRIAHILETMGAEFAPNILALTFTNAGVHAMRKRLIQFIGTELAYQVGIYTFHSFAEAQIKKNPEFFEDFAFSQVITDIEKIKIIEEILSKKQWKYLKTFASDHHYTQKIISAIDTIKSEGITPDEFKKSIATVKERVLENEGESAFFKVNRGENKKGDIKKIVLEKIDSQTTKQKELHQIYQMYQKELGKRRRYDFSDMVLSVVQQAEKNKIFREMLQENFLYLLVDEHQDTNDAQSKIIELICEAEVNERRPNIFTVGDEKQAIYRFQGASLDNFLSFRNKYLDVKIIHLTNNYRSSQNILDASNSLILSQKKLVAQNADVAAKKSKLRHANFSHRKGELIFLAEDIRSKIRKGISPSEIAIFYKQNKELGEIKKTLDILSIPYNVNSRENMLDDREVKKLFMLFDVIENPYDDEKLSKALFINFLQFDPHDVLKILEKFSNRKGAPMKNKSILKIISSKEILQKLEISDSQKFLDFASLLKEMKKVESNLDFSDFFQKVVHESGFLENILSLPDNISPLKRLEKITDEVKKQQETKPNYKLKDFLHFISTLSKYDLKIEIGKNTLLEGVQLMTAHGSKGLEFEHVYITNFVDSLWGGTRKRGEAFVLPTLRVQGGIDDERRLFFVALTRGKKEVTLSYGQTDMEGKDKISSRFLEEIGEDFKEELIIKEKDDLEKIKYFFGSGEDKVLSIFDTEYIKKLFLENTLSVSALNNYFQSPIKYFFRNLVRLPSTQTKSQILGNIVHGTLESYFTLGRKEHRTPNKKELKELFLSSMEKFSIPEIYYDEIKLRGIDILEKYFDRYSQEFDFDIETEKKMYAEIALRSGDIIKIYGIVDKIEKMSEGKIRVIDYKTGKTFGEKTKDQKADLERQVVFYKLLIDKFYNANRVSEGVLDFVEESKKDGGFIKEVRQVNSEDVEKLKSEIEFFAHDILSGEFLQRSYKKDKINEEYYDLWELLKSTH